MDGIMKGYRFYEEVHHKDTHLEFSNETVVAVKWEGNKRVYDGVYAARNLRQYKPFPAAEIVEDWLTQLYLDSECRRVSEKRAREIHPRLFECLEKGE
jgi:hypothetical protein